MIMNHALIPPSVTSPMRARRSRAEQRHSVSKLPSTVHPQGQEHIKAELLQNTLQSTPASYVQAPTTPQLRSPATNRVIITLTKLLPPKLRGNGFYHARISPHRDIRVRETHSNPNRTLTPILDTSMIKNSAPDSLAIADKRHPGYTVV
ncbi:unnamed protein product [Microthlaspi erraticum]|uniref:Uncharacterized protein n=1 Tax=Microthlaspi erraticum TaxID=1685480 RepID=A0A6D2I0C8_9BRAS|nr:unnamed protein product [Microthlaspi erraticum]